MASLINRWRTLSLLTLFFFPVWGCNQAPMTGSPFAQYDVSLRVGQQLIASGEVSPAKLHEAVQAHNAAVALEGLPAKFNREALDTAKVQAWYGWMASQTDFLAQIAHKTLYVNNPHFRLAPPEPTRPGSYGPGLVLTLPDSAGKLIMPAVDFGAALVPDTVLMEEAYAYFLDKNDRIESLEADLKSASAEEDHEALNQLYEVLVVEKYCRFTALAVWKAQLEAQARRGGGPASLAADLQRARYWFEEWMVPPLR